MFILYTRQIDYFVSLLSIYFNGILKNLSVEKQLKNAIILSTRLIILRSGIDEKTQKSLVTYLNYDSHDSWTGICFKSVQ